MQHLRLKADAAYLHANMQTIEKTMTLHLTVGSLLLAMLATTILGQLAHAPTPQPAVAMVQQNATMPGRGFEGAFSRGSAVRNLVF